MAQYGTTRRSFLASTAAIGALAMTTTPKAAFGQERVLRLRLDADNDILDPAHMTGAGEIEAQMACLPFLAEYVRDGDALDWRPTLYVTKLEQRDPTHIDFELVEGLTWSGDYGPVTAADVKFSFERMKSGDWSGYFDALDHVEVTGERSGTIVLNQPFAPFIMVTLCHGPGAIVSERAVTAVGGTFTTAFPAVCGPYEYEAIPGQKAIFTLRPEWNGPRPAFDRVECNVISETRSSELAFEAGELDCTAIGTDTLARYTASPPENVEITVAGELQYMWMGMNTEHPKLRDKTVRRAIQHAIDVESIIAGAFSGTVTKSNGIICPGLIGHREDTTYYHYDPQKARDLLAEAGVSGLELTLRTLNWQERVLAAQIIQANLAAVGITVTVLPLDSGPFWEMGSEAAGDQWQDLEIWLMRFGTTPDPYEATQWFVSSQVGVWNWERWTDPEYDRLYLEGIAETDEARRREIYLRMQDIMEETGAYVWIDHEPEVYAHTRSIMAETTPEGDQVYRRFADA